MSATDLINVARPAPAAEIASCAGYFRAARAAAAGAAVAARGREAGEALGSHPAAAVAQTAARVVALVGTRDGTELVTTIAGGMRLGDYLPTRTFELAVHTADLAAALGVPPDVPASAAAQAPGHFEPGISLSPAGVLCVAGIR